MSDSLRYQKIAPHPRQTEHTTRKKGREGLLRRIVSVIIGLLVFILIAQIIFNFFIAPRIALRTISLDTDMDMTLEQVKALGQIEIGELFHRIREGDIHDNLVAHPSGKKGGSSEGGFPIPSMLLSSDAGRLVFLWSITRV